MKSIITANGVKYKLDDGPGYKMIEGPDYNLSFSKIIGSMRRWGKTHADQDDPCFSPVGPELADVEITTSCSGTNGTPCKFCYKGNTPAGINMSLGKFKKVLAALPKTVCQIAFGVDATCTSNPDCWDIFNACRKAHIIPNVTVANVDKETAEKLVGVMGAVAVSRYADKKVCYDSISNLRRAQADREFDRPNNSCGKPRQPTKVNMHLMLSEETYPLAVETLNDYNTEWWGGSLVFLSLKQKGRGTSFTPLGDAKFRELIALAEKLEVPIGFDSCLCHRYLACVEEGPWKSEIAMMCEPCEAGCFSLYINAEGKVFPCSFIEGTEGWERGLKLVGRKRADFLLRIWYHPSMVAWRKKLLACGRQCPVYNIG